VWDPAKHFTYQCEAAVKVTHPLKPAPARGCNVGININPARGVSPARIRIMQRGI
jgi:hypothetical protein